MKVRIMTCLFWIGGVALSIATLFGGRCPVQGCPACKLVGK